MFSYTNTQVQSWMLLLIMVIVLNVSVGASNEPKFQVSNFSKSSCFRQVILLLDVYDVIERDYL